MFESYTFHNRNTTNEDGNGKPPHKVDLPRKNSEPSVTLEIEYTVQFFIALDRRMLKGNPP